MAVAFVVIPRVACGQTADEYEVKAAFLYNLTKFVEWPRSDSESFSICILGDDPFGPTINQLVKGKTVNGKRLEIRRIKEAAEARQCQIVYVRSEEKHKAAELLDAVQKMPVLTVTEQSGSGKSSCLVYLSTIDDHISLGINAAAAESSGLKISAKLLMLAKTSGEK